MKSFILLLICFFMTSCDGKDCCTVIDLQVGIAYYNENGDDLLNPSTINHFLENKIKVYYLVDGEKKEIFRGNLENLRMFEISSSMSSEKIIKYGLTLFLNDLSSKEIKTTYLQLSENDTDTITHTLQKTNNNNKIIDKVWYNGKLSSNRHTTFKIVKK